MLDKIVPPPITQFGPPLSNFRFLVIFYGIGGLPLPNPIDIRFQKVSGIGVNLSSGSKKSKADSTVTVPEEKSQPSELTLERGFIPGISPLRKEIEILLATSKFEPRTIHVMLMNELGIPMANWLFFDARLTGYSLGDLDADQNSIFVERMEFQYDQFIQLSL